jgi:hypothetical protein
VIVVAKARDLGEVVAREGGVEILALAQDGQSGEAGLKTLQTDLFEQAPVVIDRPAPFAVVVGLVTLGLDTRVHRRA